MNDLIENNFEILFMVKKWTTTFKFQVIWKKNNFEFSSFVFSKDLTRENSEKFVIFGNFSDSIYHRDIIMINIVFILFYEHVKICLSALKIDIQLCFKQCLRDFFSLMHFRIKTVMKGLDWSRMLWPLWLANNIRKIVLRKH